MNPKACAGLVVGLLAVAAAAVADWPSFRGPNHDGISDEKGLKTEWTTDLPLVWDRSLGSGFSSFACVGDRVYTAGTAEGKQVIYCLDAPTGKTNWEKPIEDAYPEPQGGDGPRATPTIDEDRLYMLGARGKLLCLATADGAEIWSHSFAHMPQWGYSGSVLIEGDLAISSGGESDGGLIAFDKKTGKVRWTCSEEPAGYATPYPFTFEGKRYVVGFTGESAIIAELETGRLVWRRPWKTDWKVNAAAPIFADGYLFLSSGYSTGSALFKLRAEGDKLAADEVWRKERLFLNKFQSSILYEGHLYGCDQNALICADFLTGEEKWREKRGPQGGFQNGTMAFADGVIFLLTEQGTLQIGRASPQGWKPQTTAQILSGRCWTLPVLHNGRLYARNLERAVCFNLRGS
jgi:outer membrane protein assembly factor BamB